MENRFDNSASWVILSPIEQSIKRKIESIGVPLKDWDISINYGIKTGFNEAFIIDGAKKDELIAADPKSAEIIRPILRGRDIKRYSYEFADLYIIATFPSKMYNIDDYPAVKEYLLSFGIDRLEQTGKVYRLNGTTIKARKKTTNKWFETQDSISYWDDFSRQKIVWGNLCLSAQYAYVENEVFINAPSTMIVGGTKYLLALLNSIVVDWYIRQLGVSRNGGYFEYKPMFVEQAPIPNVTKEIQDKIELLVDKLLDLYPNNEIEKELDNIVFSLYNLSSEEISFLDSKSEIKAISSSENE